MASIGFPQIAKTAKLSDGTTYGYISISPSPDSNEPTFVLLHGYPSSSYDWRHQITGLTEQGYGVLVPDLLGYGDTDAPEEVEKYRMKRMAGHVVELMDREGVKKAVAVGHDWGSGLLSRLPTYHADRFYGIVPVAMSYIEPGAVWDIDAICETSKKNFGYPTHGYWYWHNTDQAAKDCEEHPDAHFSLFYPNDPNTWKTDFGPPNRAQAWITSQKTTPLPSWYPKPEFQTRQKIFAKCGYHGGLNWYKAAMRGVNNEDEKDLSEEQKKVKMPVLLIAAEQDYVCRSDTEIPRTEKWCEDLRVEKLGSGHWVQLEEPEKVNELLVGFAERVVGGNGKIEGK